MVTTFYPPYHFGGDALYVKSLSEALAELGHHVEVIHCEDAFNTVNHAKKTITSQVNNKVTVHRLKSRLGLLSAIFSQQTGKLGTKKKKIETILSQEFDVVHFHNISLVGGPEVLHYSKAPINLYTLHEHWLVCPTHILWKNNEYACDKPECFSCVLKSGIPPQLWRYTSLLQKALTNIDLFLSPSKFTAEQHKKLNIDDRIKILPLFSNLSPTSPRVSSISRPLFLFVGRVTKSKGIFPLLELMSSRSDCDLYVIGEGDYLAELKVKFSSCTHISFLGHIEQKELIKLYQNCTALILPSLAPETFGLTIVEAFSCGTPAIVKNAGGCSEIVKSSGAGFVYQNNDELLIAIEQVMNPKIREQLSIKARKTYEKEYTLASHLKNYLAIIEKIQQEKEISK